MADTFAPRWETLNMSDATIGTGSLLWGTGRGRGWGWPIIGGLGTAILAVIEDKFSGSGPSVWSGAIWGGVDGAVVALAIGHLSQRLGL